jgi:hypothetical protein
VTPKPTLPGVSPIRVYDAAGWAPNPSWPSPAKISYAANLITVVIGGLALVVFARRHS